MNSDRINQLQAFLKETPDDPFLLYALALEYVREKPQSAGKLFNRLLTEFSDYLPTYYQAAAYFLTVGKNEKAREIYEQGIALARQQSEPLTLRELQSAYNQFLFEEDED